MTTYDYIVIGFYLVFMFLLGPIYKNFSKTSSDFFRGGGGMLWWVVGASAFMNTFTAWAFTGGAAKAYETGTFFLLLFACNLVAMLFCYFFVVAKYRQMRIITVMEGVRKRFGKTSEQSLTWLLILARTLFGGLALYTVAVFMASVFGVEMWLLIIGLGTTITLMTVFGGSWSATAGDFVQMMVVVVITVTMGILTLVKVGGVGEFIEKIPQHHFNWTLFDRPSVIIFYFITLSINQLIQMNSLIEGAAKYIFVKDAHDAKKAIFIQMIGVTVLSLIWIVPPMIATVWHPDLASEYPTLNNPSEAAYVAMAKDLLPAGLMGLLVCGIFAATVTSYNSQLNIVGGSFVRNIYIQVIKPSASEKEQIFVGRIFMLAYGALWIIIGLIFMNYKSLKLFDMLLLLAASTGLPLAVPLFLGIFFKKTPPWSGWSSMLAGFIAAMGLRLMFWDKFLQFLWKNPEMTSKNLLGMLWGGADLRPQEIDDLNLAITMGVISAASVGWFFITMLFYRKDNKQYIEQVDKFFKDMDTPISKDENELSGYDNDARQYNVLGNLCLVYGIFISLLVLVPNPLKGRLCILVCGSVVVGTGIILKKIGLGLKKKALAGSD